MTREGAFHYRTIPLRGGIVLFGQLWGGKVVLLIPTGTMTEKKSLWQGAVVAVALSSALAALRRALRRAQRRAQWAQRPDAWVYLVSNR